MKHKQYITFNPNVKTWKIDAVQKIHDEEETGQEEQGENDILEMLKNL